MVAALIAAFACAGLAQFGISWWRATVSNTATRPFSEKIRMLAEQCGLSIESEDFNALRVLFECCPELGNAKEGFGGVMLYHGILRRVQLLLRRALPPVADWATREMAMCSRYAAVMMDQRLARTQAMMAELRSF